MKEAGPHRGHMYDSLNRKFKNRQNTSMVIEVKIVVTLGNSNWKGAQGGFQSAGNVLFPNLGSSS